MTDGSETDMIPYPSDLAAAPIDDRDPSGP